MPPTRRSEPAGESATLHHPAAGTPGRSIAAMDARGVRPPPCSTSRQPVVPFTPCSPAYHRVAGDGIGPPTGSPTERPRRSAAAGASDRRSPTGRASPRGPGRWRGTPPPGDALRSTTPIGQRRHRSTPVGRSSPRKGAARRSPGVDPVRSSVGTPSWRTWCRTRSHRRRATSYEGRPRNRCYRWPGDPVRPAAVGQPLSRAWCTAGRPDRDRRGGGRRGQRGGRWTPPRSRNHLQLDGSDQCQPPRRCTGDGPEHRSPQFGPIG
jgi:hypothetical protein